MLDLLLPQRCVVCSRPGDQLCGGCRSGLRRLVPPLCERCGAPTAWPVRRCVECTGRRLAFATARAAVAYDEAARRLVRAWKEQGLRGLAVAAAEEVAAALEPPPRDAAALVVVPPDRDRTLQRGLHPALGLGRELARRWDVPLAPLLSRTRAARPQRGLTHAARRRNVAGAFAPTDAVPRTVLLLDDVYTTGATVAAAASALRRGGARRVDVVTFARTIRLR